MTLIFDIPLTFFLEEENMITIFWSPYLRVDTVREAAEMMAPLQDKSLAEILRSLLKMKKVKWSTAEI